MLVGMYPDKMTILVLWAGALGRHLPIIFIQEKTQALRIIGNGNALCPSSQSELATLADLDVIFCCLITELYASTDCLCL